MHGLDTLYADDALAVMPAVDALRYSLSHFDNSDIWFKASYDLNVKTGWLGRWIDSNGSADQPAAGDLDRHRAVEVDPHGGQPGVRDPVADLARLQHELARARSGDINVNAQMQALAGVPGGSAQRLPRASARDVRAWRSRRTSAR